MHRVIEHIMSPLHKHGSHQRLGKFDKSFMPSAEAKLQLRLGPQEGAPDSHSILGKLGGCSFTTKLFTFNSAGGSGKREKIGFVTTVK